MRLLIADDPRSMGAWVAQHAAADLRQAIATTGAASLVVATGASQFEVLAALVKQPDIQWSRVTAFHLDEYVGLSSEHPASFCRYLQERFVSQVPLANFHFLRGDSDIESTLDAVGSLLRQRTIDVTLCGIGENGHLAFNDPPADFAAEAPYLIVQLDEACRKQQVGEGWFASLEDVPTAAMSMSVRQILRSKRIYCSVPDERKSIAVRDSVEGPVTPMVPASILQTHPDTCLVIDLAASARLTPETRNAAEKI